MFHGLTNEILYAAVKIVSYFEDSLGKKTNISGTCFFVQVDEFMHLVTNRHVVDARYHDEKYKDFLLVGIELTGRFSGQDLLQVILPPKQNQITFSINELNDIACISNPQMQTPRTGEKHIQLDYFVSENMFATEDDFQNDLYIGDFVAFPGFPEWHDQVNHRPILRNGTISSDPRFNYFTSKDMGDCLAYEAFSYDGSSGSPVFALQKGIKPGAGLAFEGYRPVRLLGINAGHLKGFSTDHSGISYFYKSTAILETIRSGKDL